MAVGGVWSDVPARHPLFFWCATLVITAAAAARAWTAHRAQSATAANWRALRGQLRLAALGLLFAWLFVLVTTLLVYPLEPVSLVAAFAVAGWTSIGANVFAPDLRFSAVWLNLHIIPTVVWSFIVHPVYGWGLAAVMLVFWVFVHMLNQKSNLHLRGMVEAQVALEQQAEELRAAKRLAEEAARARSDFLAHMSHEIRTPLNGILGIGTLLEDTPLNEEQRELVAVMQSSGRLLNSLVNDILDYSKVRAGKLAVDLRPLPLADLFRLATKPFELEARAKGLRLACHVVPPELNVVADSLRLNQVLTNLVSNALKFTSQGSIEVSARRAAPGWVRVEVKDTGIGIAPDAQGKIFEEFVQAERGTTRRFGGTGLGLAIAARLTELMGGRIGVSSTLGHGSTFFVELPEAISESRT